jgi:acyl-homoserine lactone acylase PvdQ
LFNPENGWIQNCNSTPFTSAGANSPKQSNYPNYMSYTPENYRGIHAISLLSKAKNLNLDKLIELAYDSYLPGAEELTKGLLKAYQEDPRENMDIRKAINTLKNWNFRTSETSTSILIIVQVSSLMV